jgi:4-hydroxybenzoate polyprenyltransferase
MLGGRNLLQSDSNGMNALSLQENVLLLFGSMRPRQWTKNLIVFAPIIFAAKLTEPKPLLAVIVYFFVFCLASSAVYLLNDVLDRKRDLAHPVKCRRAIASGKLSVALALLVSTCLATISLALSLLIRPSLVLITIAYFALSILYSTTIKNMVILDVMAIAAGFILRAIGGGFAAVVPISGWFLICASFGSLFLALEKRRHELNSLESAGEHRPALSNYSKVFLDRIEGVVTPALLISYILYSLLSYHGQWMLLTIPFVFYGIAHYQRLSIRGDLTGTPEEILLQDRPMQIAILLWLVTSLGVLYGVIPRFCDQLIHTVDTIKIF